MRLIMERVRKALMAGMVAGGGALLAAVTAEVPTSLEGWSAVVGGALAAGLLAAYATWRVPNAPALTYQGRALPRP